MTTLRVVVPPQHVRAVCKDPKSCPDTCNICNLFLCSVCGGFEGSLLPICPGKQLTQEEHEANYAHYCAGTGPFHGWRDSVVTSEQIEGLIRKHLDTYAHDAELDIPALARYVKEHL